ncbi:Adaptin ear-binding coat-associated protein 2 [Borealophlyctis nickersoniae]|nr:Adaptin ear-binding coat-associated protein 2 [Borealophlyctis nickersoniae]
MSEEYESVLLVIKECFVYRIPPRANARGYRASDWDVNQFLFKGRLRVIARGEKAVINLEDANSGELFATCPYDPVGNSVEPVLDSSRYFVLRIVDPGSGQHAFVGMGFPERSWAFDFNVTLQDHAKHIQKQKEAVSAPKVDSGPKVDYSWKEGQTISINIGNMGSKKPKAKGDDGGGQIPFLPPPPPGGKSSHGGFGGSSGNLFQQQQQQQPGGSGSSPAQTQAEDGNEWADFGNFESAPTASNSRLVFEFPTFAFRVLMFFLVNL